MKILYLPLKKEWYEMIERGEKTEEYSHQTHTCIMPFGRTKSSAIRPLL